MSPENQQREFRPVGPPPPGEEPLEFRVEEETSGMVKWRVRSARRPEREFLVKWMGATQSKVEELHHRQLTSSDLALGIYRAVGRARLYLENRLDSGAEPPDEIEVAMRDSDLAELAGRVAGPTNQSPN